MSKGKIVEILTKTSIYNIKEIVIRALFYKVRDISNNIYSLNINKMIIIRGELLINILLTKLVSLIIKDID